jgi:hypothetical protein
MAAGGEALVRRARRIGGDQVQIMRRDFQLLRRDLQDRRADALAELGLPVKMVMRLSGETLIQASSMGVCFRLPGNGAGVAESWVPPCSAACSRKETSRPLPATSKVRRESVIAQPSLSPPRRV